MAREQNYKWVRDLIASPESLEWRPLTNDALHNCQRRKVIKRLVDLGVLECRTGEHGVHEYCLTNDEIVLEVCDAEARRLWPVQRTPINAFWLRCTNEQFAQEVAEAKARIQKAHNHHVTMESISAPSEKDLD